MTRATEVIDTWFDSGSMPYAQWHYPFEHQAEFAAHFPADFICEGVDQTRGWFYSLLAISTAAFDAPAYRHVIVNELVLDAEGQKMSKSRGNVVNPTELLAEYGADVVRLYLLVSSQVWLPKRFDARTIPDVAGGFLNTLKNTYRFFAQYAAGWQAGSPGAARLDGAGRPLDPEPAGRHGGCRQCRVGGLRRHRRRPGRDGIRGRRPLQLVRPAQPAALLGAGPRGRSGGAGHPAHLPGDRGAAPRAGGAVRRPTGCTGRWPAPRFTWRRSRRPAAPRDAALEAAMDAVRRLASLARAAREEVGLGVRQPLGRHAGGGSRRRCRGRSSSRCSMLLSREVNVKSVEVVLSDADLVTAPGQAQFPRAGQAVRQGDPGCGRGRRPPGRPSSSAQLEAGGTATVEVNGTTI